MLPIQSSAANKSSEVPSQSDEATPLRSSGSPQTTLFSAPRRQRSNLCSNIGGGAVVTFSVLFALVVIAALVGLVYLLIVNGAHSSNEDDSDYTPSQLKP